MKIVAANWTLKGNQTTGEVNRRKGLIKQKERIKKSCGAKSETGGSVVKGVGGVLLQVRGGLRGK